ncbi:M20 aminoacylase family protein [Sphingomonas sp. TX0543]|uniref:M20 aminoacylase family protein n=1 Tax=unclassified Sphingomonas TaxID=196159 RepID=UPI0010F49CF1|nr:M20 aminoacylase family protein [Sphingomonas sp. 3P27F8]
MTLATPVRANVAPALAGIEAFLDDAIALRHDFHRHPELSWNEHRTAARVAELLEEWGYRVTTGVGGNGVVGTLRRGTGTKSLGLRADMDALPIAEASGLPFASETAGVMHACGHDGHTTILLAAARYLAEAGDLSGTLHLFFQPAEEIGQGARAMIADGLFDRFPCDAVYGLHNWPGLPVGRFGILDGPAMASVDWIGIRVVGKGGHGAAPHETVDPVVAAAHVITALQSIVARNVAPLDAAVVTVGSIHGGDAANVIPDHVDLTLTARSFRAEVREALQRRIPEIARGVAASFGATAEVELRRGFPSVVNHPREAEIARGVARDLLGEDALIPDIAPRTASEDFAFMLEARPGAFLFLGTGPGEPLHSPRYRFNDDVIAPGAALWARLAETFLT